VVGVDLEDPKLEAEWATRSRPNLAFRAMSVERLEFGDREFDLVAATEVLEHVEEPERAVAEMARVAGRWLLVSVPHEPLWRALNMARGAYLRELGNTPGHLNHWTRRSFVSLLARHGEVVQTRAPFPWTMLLVRVDSH
jgi:2-polyprenyl-3-methyl-5-hydroxy-6-metoxy-1,4-benzoquinol methylase